MEYIFWVGLMLVFYSYAIYPLLLVVINKIYGPADTRSIDSDDIDLPAIAIVIAAYNEEVDICNRLDNIANLNYPTDKIVTYIGSDGSEDETNKIIKNHNLNNLKFFTYSQRRGKASVLNDLCGEVKEEILIFSDANTMFDNSAVSRIVNWFFDPMVGGVCGELEIHSNDTGSNQDSYYWKYEKFLKEKESRINGLLGANGGIYAIRKELYKSIAADTITDDFMIAMNVVLQNYRLIYESSAVAHETAPDSVNDEFKRRVRIGTGNYQAFFRLANVLNPFSVGIHFFTYLSHKVIRWFAPHILVLCFIINMFLLDTALYIGLLLAQILIYGAAVVSLIYPPNIKLPRLLSLLLFFVNMNIALLIGFYKFITSNISPTWDRTSR